MASTFADLSDEIGADDWLIPRSEITRRRLVGQTKQYRIYKADWFGDVLVYEPIIEDKNSPLRDQSDRKELGQRRLAARFQDSMSSYQVEDFRRRLGELCSELNSKSSSSTTRESSVSANLKRATASNSGSCASDKFLAQQMECSDSAYSSLSSTPQCYDKQHEFQFPVGLIRSSSSSSSASSSVSASSTEPETLGSARTSEQSNYLQQDREHERQLQKQQEDILISEIRRELQATTSNAGPRKLRKSPGLSTPPVILNKSSFFHDEDHDHDDDNLNYMSTSSISTIHGATRTRQAQKATVASSSGWFELNELRLVAHENFLLFMGASFQEGHEAGLAGSFVGDCSNPSASLVMQMSHPKSATLFDLLHANKRGEPLGRSTCSPTIDRFFELNRLQQPQLNIAAKLNICQQVTDAMTYLHDKNIVHGRLTSVNIYIEQNQRVKISLLDNDELMPGHSNQHDMGDQPGLTSARAGVTLNMPTLTYLSPELVRTIRVDLGEFPSETNASAVNVSKVKLDTALLTKEADIYAFGTLLYELFEERFPFADESIKTAPRSPSLNGAELFEQLCLAARSPTRRVSPATLSPRSSTTISPSTASSMVAMSKDWNGNIKCTANELIYQIGSGLIRSKNKTSNKSPELVDEIISACWKPDPSQRPTFKHLKFD